MAEDVAPVSRQAVLIGEEGLAALLSAFHDDGFVPVAPVVRDGAVVTAPIDREEGLPAGWLEETGAGKARVRRREDLRRFGHLLGAAGWKRYFAPPRRTLFEARRTGRKGAFVAVVPEAAVERWALVGVRPCDLAALSTLDRVFSDGPYPDPAWRAARHRTFVVAVACTEPAATCFCASTGTGPGLPDAGFDLGVVEIGEAADPVWLLRAGSERGATVLARLPARAATADAVAAADRAVAAASRSQTRALRAGYAEALRARTELSAYEAVGERCLACGNCTLVCPTCFCSTGSDRISIDGNVAARERLADTCFSREFSVLHGGAVRSSRASRYRQWIRHKLVHLEEQFRSPGCVGCGRCIAWCPAAIDLTAEA